MLPLLAASASAVALLRAPTSDLRATRAASSADSPCSDLTASRARSLCSYSIESFACHQGKGGETYCSN